MRWPSGRAVEPHLGRRVVDPVEVWKRLARADALRNTRARIAGPTLEVRISTGLVLLTMLLGLPFGPLGPVTMLSLVASVLVAQELPRALLARSLGRSATVQLSVQGGSTTAGTALVGSAGVAFASIGSAVNLAVAIAGYVLSRHAPGNRLGGVLLGLAEAHAVWGIAQALPFLPFRAGDAVAARLRGSYRFLHASSSLVLTVLAFVVLVGWLKAVALVPLTVLAMVSGARSLIEAHGESRDEHEGILAECSSAEACLAAGDPKLASTIAADALRVACSAAQRQRLWKAMVWAAIGRQDPFAAHAALGRLPAEAIDVHLVASYLGCCNRLDEAVLLLEQARAFGFRTPETTKLLLDLHHRCGDIDAIHAVLRNDSALLSSDERTVVEAALSASWAVPRSTPS